MTRRRSILLRPIVSIRTITAVLYLCAASALLGGCATTPPPDPDPRPIDWAMPLTAAGVPNLHRVNASLYRSAQPTRDGIADIDHVDLLVNGDSPIKTIVSLRTMQTDAPLSVGSSTVKLEHISVQSWQLEDEDVVQFLRIATDPARDEMTRGGYGFHPVWQNLIRYIENLDVAAIRAQVQAPLPTAY
jgi:hypothetical protein